jgi:hypothetical protein
MRLRSAWAESGPPDLAELALCLLYAGQPAAARAVTAAAWPPALPGRLAFERKLAGRLACSPHFPPLRAAQPAAERWPTDPGCRR